MASEMLELPNERHQAPRTIDLPAPTAWPIILAFGFTLAVRRIRDQRRP